MSMSLVLSRRPFSYTRRGLSAVSHRKPGAPGARWSSSWDKAFASRADRSGVTSLIHTKPRPEYLVPQARAIASVESCVRDPISPVRERSRKHDEAIARIERFCPGPRVELFAREAREGWILGAMKSACSTTDISASH